MRGQLSLSPFFVPTRISPWGCSSQARKDKQALVLACLELRNAWPDKKRLHLWDRFDRIRTVASCHISFVNEEGTRATWSLFLWPAGAAQRGQPQARKDKQATVNLSFLCQGCTYLVTASTLTKGD